MSKNDHRQHCTGSCCGGEGPSMAEQAAQAGHNRGARRIGDRDRQADEIAVAYSEAKIREFGRSKKVA